MESKPAEHSSCGHLEVAATAAAREPHGSPRIVVIDWLRVIAMLAVVVMHAGGDRYLADSGAERFLRFRLVVFNVATFFVISGFLAADAPVMSARLLAVRLVRIVPPYLVASLTVLALGFASVTTLEGLLYTLGIGSALGIYYFVFNLVVAFGLMFVLTQVYPPVLPYVVGACVAWWVLEPMLTESRFLGTANVWVMRDPTRYFPYVALGWLARRNLDALRSFWNGHRNLLVAIAMGIVVAYLAAPSVGETTPLGLPLRACYVAAVLVLGVRALSGSPGGRTLHLLSEASYTIYLYHMLFILPLLPYASSLQPLVRIPVLTVLGVVGGVLVSVVGRAVLGRHSRWVIGA